MIAAPATTSSPITAPTISERACDRMGSCSIRTSRRTRA
ncbi:Uncharacterised protein [Mycobacteroides abscessus subsp. abscessus]|nr:Uncharacterised protein [Mycobacteroides abscessus subsp. abscessus]